MNFHRSPGTFLISKTDKLPVTVQVLRARYPQLYPSKAYEESVSSTPERVITQEGEHVRNPTFVTNQLSREQGQMHWARCECPVSGKDSQRAIDLLTYPLPE